MRHSGPERDTAKPLPGNRIGHLPTQHLIAQPVAKLQKHQPQVGLHRNRWTTDSSIEALRTGRRTPDHPAAHRLAPTPPTTPTAPTAKSRPTTSAGRLPYETRWSRSLLSQGFETIVPVQNLSTRIATPTLFQVEVTSGWAGVEFLTKRIYG